MRCPECNKFVSFDSDTEPEVNSLEIDEDGNVSGDVRIFLTCAECNTELKETNFDVTFEADVPEGHKNVEGEESKHDLSIEADNVEVTTRTETHDAKGKPVYARKARTYYGYSLDYSVSCACQEQSADALVSGNIGDETQASNMDEMT